MGEDESEEATANVTTLFMTLPTELRTRIGHQLGKSEDMVSYDEVMATLRKCKFMGKDCNNERCAISSTFSRPP